MRILKKLPIKFLKEKNNSYRNLIRDKKQTSLSKTLKTFTNCHTHSLQMNTFTAQEWRELEYECLAAQMEQHILAESRDSLSIQRHTSSPVGRLVQEHVALTNAYHNMINHQQTLTNADEWETIEEITFGNHDSFTSQEYLHLWDEHEMLYDLNAFESDVHAQVYLANSLTPHCDTPVTLSTHGPNYSTGECLYGKVYVPKHLTKYLQTTPKNCRIIYNGCEDARESANIRMPWKCIYVNK